MRERNISAQPKAKRSQLAPLDEAPGCRYCGKALKPRYRSVTAIVGRPPIVPERAEPPKVGEWCYVDYGPKIIAVDSAPTYDSTKRVEEDAANVRVATKTYRVWCGEWGRYGDGLFCGLTCGYTAAVRDRRKP